VNPSSSKERGEICKRDETPLSRLSQYFIVGESPKRLTHLRGWLFSKGIKRGEAPLRNYFPLPLTREGGQGDRLLNDIK